MGIHREKLGDPAALDPEFMITIGGENMPGLVGFVSEFAQDTAEKLLVDMADTLKYNDLYRVDAYQEKGFGIGRVTLGITNSDPQPFWNEDQTVCIIMEGEIYDYQDSKKRLIRNGHCFQTNSDAEYVLHLFEELGEEFVSHLNGAYLVAIWDRRLQKLIITNDRFGLLPLYYSQQNNAFTFASSLQALTAVPNCRHRVDSLTVAQLLTFDYALGDRTLLMGAKVLPPASILTFYDYHLTLHPYWTLEFQDTCRPLSIGEYIEGFAHYMQQAVVRQASDDTPKGILLSGGLDSRMIAAFLGKGTQAGALHTFTFGIPNCDDARLAQEVASKLNTQHHFDELKPDYLLHMSQEGIRRTNGMMNCVHMHAFANLQTQTGYTNIIYKGFMGDALTGGHLERNLWADYDEHTLAHMIFAEATVLFDPNEQKELFADSFQQDIKNNVFQSFQAVLAESNAGLAANKYNHFDLSQRQRRFILNGVDLVRSRAVVRTPFCDNDLVEYMLKVPPGLRLDRFLMVQTLIRQFPDLAKIPYTGTGLPLMACMRDLRIRISRQVRWHLHSVGLLNSPTRKKKHYADYNHWLRTTLRSWVEETLLRKPTLERGYYNPEYIRRLVAEHMMGANHSLKLGMLLTIELWHQQFID